MNVLQLSAAPLYTLSRPSWYSSSMDSQVKPVYIPLCLNIHNITKAQRNARHIPASCSTTPFECFKVTAQSSSLQVLTRHVLLPGLLRSPFSGCVCGIKRHFVDEHHLHTQCTVDDFRHDLRQTASSSAEGERGLRSAGRRLVKSLLFFPGSIALTAQLQTTATPPPPTHHRTSKFHRQLILNQPKHPCYSNLFASAISLIS